MKYILPFLLIFFIGCEKKEHHNREKVEKNSTKKVEISKNEKIVDGLKFINNRLKIEKKEILLLCKEKNSKCKEEAEILKRLKINYKMTNNKFLIDYFKIKLFPTILIVDKNITKYEGFTPYEILKMEEF